MGRKQNKTLINQLSLPSPYLDKISKKLFLATLLLFVVDLAFRLINAHQLYPLIATHLSQADLGEIENGPACTASINFLLVIILIMTLLYIYALITKRPRVTMYLGMLKLTALFFISFAIATSYSPYSSFFQDFSNILVTSTRYTIFPYLIPQSISAIGFGISLAKLLLLALSVISIHPFGPLLYNQENVQKLLQRQQTNQNRPDKNEKNTD